MDSKRAFDNQPRIAELVEYRRKFQLDPQVFRPWLFRPCVVRILIVGDGFIDFDDTDFGLGEFLRALFNSPAYVRFDVTCAHRSNVSDIEIGVGRPGVVRTIKQFSFTDANHFGRHVRRAVAGRLGYQLTYRSKPHRLVGPAVGCGAACHQRVHGLGPGRVRRGHVAMPLRAS